MFARYGVLVLLACLLSGCVTARNDFLLVQQNTSTRFDPRENDKPRSARIVTASPAAHGGVGIEDWNSLSYLPSKGYSGPDAFTYTIEGAFGRKETATVFVYVESKAVSQQEQDDVDAAKAALGENSETIVGPTGVSPQRAASMAGLNEEAAPNGVSDTASVKPEVPSKLRMLYPPKRFVLVEPGLFPGRDQGECGSCWAFAVVGAVEVQMSVSPDFLKRQLDLSEQQILDCSGAGSCKDGSRVAAVEWMKKAKQLTDEDAYPYSGTMGQCKVDVPRIMGESGAWKPYPWTFSSIGAENIKQIMWADGSRGRPLTIGMHVPTEDKEKMRIWSKYTGGVLKDLPDALGLRPNHAVVVVGWDDEREALLIRNSYGSSWGINGYAWVKYGNGNFSNPLFVSCGFAPDGYKKYVREIIGTPSPGGDIPTHWK